MQRRRVAFRHSRCVPKLLRPKFQSSSYQSNLRQLHRRIDRYLKVVIGLIAYIQILKFEFGLFDNWNSLQSYYRHFKNSAIVFRFQSFILIHCQFYFRRNRRKHIGILTLPSCNLVFFTQQLEFSFHRLVQSKPQFHNNFRLSDFQYNISVQTRSNKIKLSNIHPNLVITVNYLVSKSKFNGQRSQKLMYHRT